MNTPPPPTPQRRTPPADTPQHTADAPQHRKPLRIDDLRRITTPGPPILSPDGNTIAFTAKSPTQGKRERTTIHTVDANEPDAEPQRFTNGEKDTHPRYTPDGQHLLFVSDRSGSPQVHAIPTRGGEPEQLTNLPEGVIRELAVSPAGDRIAFAFAATPTEHTNAAKEKRYADHRSEPPITIDSLWHKLDGDGFFKGARFALHTLNLRNRTHHTLYAPEHHDAFTFDFSPDGTSIALAINRHRDAPLEPKHTAILILNAETGEIARVPNLPPGPKTKPKWSPRGDTIAYAARAGDDGIYSPDNLHLFVCSPTRGEPRNLTEHTDHCLLALSVDDTAGLRFEPDLRFAPDGQRIYYRLGLRGATHIASVPTAGGPPTVHTTADAEHLPGDITPDGTRMAIAYATPTRPPEIGTIDLAVRTANHAVRTGRPPEACKTTPEPAGIEQKSRLNHALVRTRLAAHPRTIEVTSPDGTPVHTRMLLPPAHEHDHPRTGPHPAVLTIHGGPHAQYGSGFFHELQTLASHGYAVVYPNPRGSKGYGEAFCNAIRGDWAKKDWRDIRAVIDAMRAHPDIDPERLAIIGGSYGGFMVNTAITRCHDFACAITDRCVSNLSSFLGTTDMVQPPGRYFPGRFFDDDGALREMSPLRAFASVRTPTLIIHSEGDLRCSIEQSEQVFTALQLLGVPSRFVRYPAPTSHGMSRSGPPDLREHRLGEMLRWLDAHLAPGGGAAGGR